MQRAGVTRGERSDWLAPAATLCALWLVAAAGFVALRVFIGSPLPRFVATIGQFIIPGLITGRLVGVPGRRTRLIAAAVVVVVSLVIGVSAMVAIRDMSPRQGLVELAVSVPGYTLGGAWAYFGMFLGGLRKETRTSPNPTPRDPELQQLEQELRDGIARRGQD